MSIDKHLRGVIGLHLTDGVVTTKESAQALNFPRQVLADPTGLYLRRIGDLSLVSGVVFGLGKWEEI